MTRGAGAWGEPSGAGGEAGALPGAEEQQRGPRDAPARRLPRYPSAFGRRLTLCLRTRLPLPLPSSSFPGKRACKRQGRAKGRQPSSLPARRTAGDPEVVTALRDAFKGKLGSPKAGKVWASL